jgi:hypothetical protein
MPPAHHKTLVIGLRTGRLGNRLVLFANIIGFAAEHGYGVVNVAFHSYAHFFENTRRDIYCRYPVARHRSWFDRLPGAAPAIRKTRIFYQCIHQASKWNDRFPILGKSVFTLREIPRQTIGLDTAEVQARMADAKIVFVHAWAIRAPDSVKRHAEEIRDYLRPIGRFENPGRAAVDRLRREADVVIGVHIRHGDYRTWKRGACFFTVAQYAAWMQGMVEQFPGKKVSFFVCSDEPRRADEFPGLSVGIGAGPPLADICALAQCDCIFGPSSTFSQWASFYGNKPLLNLYGRDDRVELEKFRVSNLEEIP